MKILLATYFIAPHTGGVWEYMMQVKSRLERFGHTVDLFSSGEAHQSYHMPNLNQTFPKDRVLPLLYKKIDAATYPSLATNSWVRHFEFECISMELAAAYFGLQSYDLIHAQDVFAARAFSRVKPASTPLIASLHGSAAEEYRMHFEENGDDLHHSLRWKYHVALEHIGAISSDVTLTSSEWLKNKLVKEFSVTPSKVRVFQYGYDLDNFGARMQANSAIQRPYAKKVILFAGRLIALKGVHILLAALAQLQAVRQDWICWIVGDGEAVASLRQQASDLGLNQHIVFFGKRSDVPYMMSLTDIFVCPSLLDNQPLSLIEAQLSGLPSIVSDAGGIPEMVEHGVTGLIYPANDAKRLYAYLYLLLGNDSIRKTMGTAAREFAVQHWSYDLMIDRLMDVYQEQMARKG